MNKSLAHPGWGIVLLTALASLGSGLAVDALLTSFHTLGAPDHPEFFRLAFGASLSARL